METIMDAIVEIVRNLVFGAIAISVIEIVLPDNNLKKYFNYTGGIVFLAIMVGSFYNLYANRDGLLDNFQFQNQVERNMQKMDERFNENLDKNKKAFFEKNMKESISRTITDFVETHYKKKGLSVEAALVIPDDFQKVEIKEITLNGIERGVLDNDFFVFVKEKFNLGKEAILTKNDEGGKP